MGLRRFLSRAALAAAILATAGWTGQAGSATVAAASAPAVRIRPLPPSGYELRVDQGTLSEALTALGTQAGIRFRYDLLPPERLSLQCSASELRGLLNCLLGDHADLMFEYASGRNRDGSRKIAAVTIMSSSFETAGAIPTPVSAVQTGIPTALFETARGGKTGAERAEALGQLIAAEGIDPGLLLETLRNALTDANGEVRAQAVFGFGLHGGPAAYDAFRTALGDRDAGVRLMAVDSLQPDEQGRLLLEQSLHDRDPTVREFAAMKLTPVRDTLTVQGRPL